MPEHEAVQGVFEPQDKTKIPMRNLQLVTIDAGKVDILMPRVSMSREEAINLAAYLVALVDGEDEFNELLSQLDVV